MMGPSGKPTQTVFFFLLFSLSTLISPTSANCYWPNGTDRNVAVNASYPGSANEFYAPCNPDATASMCCAIGPARLSDPDTCTSNGLCFGPDGTTWWRESCTDQSWSDPACVQLYVNGTYNGLQSEFVRGPTCGPDPNEELDSGNDIPMTRCPDGSYCTGTGGAATPCCDNNQGFFILANLTVTQQNPNTTASASTSSTTSTSMVSSTSSMAVTASSSAASPTATSSSTTSSGLSTGAKAGIGVGAAIAALAILGLLFWVAKLRRSNVQRRAVQETPDVASPPPPPPPPQYDPPKQAPSTPIYEAYGTQGPPSGPNFPHPVEMEQPGA